MIRTIGDKTTGSLFQRTLAEGAAKDGTHPEAGSAASLVAGKARDGWDPYDVWVRRIHEPRRRGGDGGRRSTD